MARPVITPKKNTKINIQRAKFAGGRSALKVKMALFDIGVANRLHAVNLMDGPKSGKWYRYAGRRYQASAPGEAPANRSYKLRRDINFKASAKQLVFFTTVEYAKYLDSPKMRRYFMSRTVRERQGRNNNLLRRRLREANRET